MPSHPEKLSLRSFAEPTFSPVQPLSFQARPERLPRILFSFGPFFTTVSCHGTHHRGEASTGRAAAATSTRRPSPPPPPPPAATTTTAANLEHFASYAAAVAERSKRAEKSKPCLGGKRLDKAARPLSPVPRHGRGEEGWQSAAAAASRRLPLGFVRDRERERARAAAAMAKSRERERPPPLYS